MRSTIGSAASFLISAFIIHFFALRLDPSFSLLLTHGVGKLALMAAAILQIFALLQFNLIHLLKTSGKAQ